MHTLRRGITLVETLIAMAIIALLVFVAVPAYHDYSVRAHVGDLLMATASARVALSEGMKSHHSWSAAWVSQVSISSTGIVASASVDGASGTIFVSGTAPSSGSIITVTPRVAGDRTVTWTCRGTPLRYMPSACR